jgi:hypothetical protein
VGKVPLRTLGRSIQKRRASRIEAQQYARPFAQSRRRPTNSIDWQDRILLKDDAASFGDDLNLDCVDEVFALLAAN